MANGDDAGNAGMDVLTGNEDRRNGYDEINKSRDYIAQFINAVKTWAEGLFVPKTDVVVVGQDVAGKVARYGDDRTLVAGNPTATNHVANKAYVDARPTGVPAAGGTFTGNVYFPNASIASSGYTVAYLNGDGRLSKGASSERYKTDITLLDPAALGDIFPDLYSYRMAGGHDTARVGWIAERLAEQPTQLPFVVYQRVTEYNATTDETTTRLALDQHGNPIPDSIDFIALLIAQNAQLHQRVQQLELDHEVLATGLDLVTQRLTRLEPPA